MASIKELKREINDVLGAIIEGALIWEADNPDQNNDKAESLINDCIITFDELLSQINDRDVPDRAHQMKQVKSTFEEKARAYVTRLNALG